jgi:hypothetical protein
MRWSDIQFDPPERKLRQFAALWLIFFGGLGAWHGLVRGHELIGFALALLGVTLGALGLVRPAAIRPIFVGWMIVAFPIGWAVSRISLGLLFFGIFTPLALLFRCNGRDRLHSRRSHRGETCWTNKPIPAHVRRYFEQS